MKKISLTYLNGLETILEFDEKSEKFCHEINGLRPNSQKRLEEANNDIFVCIARMIAETKMMEGLSKYCAVLYQNHEKLLRQIGELDGSRGIKLLKSDNIDISQIEVKDKKIETEKYIIRKRGRDINMKKAYMIITLAYLTYNMTFKMEICKKTEQILKYLTVKSTHDRNFAELAKYLNVELENNDVYYTLAKHLFTRLFKKMILAEDKDLSVEDYFEKMRYHRSYFDKEDIKNFSELIQIKENNFKNLEPKVTIIK